MKTVQLEVVLYQIPSFWNLFSIIKPQGVGVRLNDKHVVCLNGEGTLKYKRYSKLEGVISTFKEIDNKQWKVLNEWLKDSVERETEFKSNKEFLELLVKVLKDM